MTQVLVAGAGPVGLTMAAELARYGVAVRILDRNAARTDKSKALVVWPRTLELLDRAGCAGNFLGSGMRLNGARIVAGGRPLARIGFGEVASPFPHGLMIPQSETERLLEDHLAGLGVRVERETELAAFDADAKGVVATLRRPNGDEETLEVDWLIGCDGAHSTVRHALGLDFGGDTLMTDWILADVHLDGLGVPPDELAIYWHAEGILVLFPISSGRYRVIADAGVVQGDARRPDPALAEVQAVLDRRGPGGVAVRDPVWLSSFRINERKVKDYRAGRVFLAGDAAHVHSPAGGQGMNTGMQDAFNLAWKLALACHGTARAPVLLDSYSAERSAVGDEVLRDAGRMTEIAILRNPVLQALRNAAARVVLGLGPVRHGMAEALSELSVGYPQSPLNGPAARHPGPPAPGERMQPRAGEAPVGAGPRPLFALFGEDADGQGAALCARHAALLEPLVRPALPGGGIRLVRPDGYVAAVADAGDWPAVAGYLAGLA
ncbi:MAG: FAD-dependent monooxygenase [Proteobacteria bacterium]|nr:FAD-dependent monooxygenase [Pseudomonadota bacterium]